MKITDGSLFTQLIQFFRQKLSNQFVRNLGWLSIAEAVNRVFRLITTVTLARFLSPQDYGLAAIVLATFEVVHVFTKTGMGVKLIQIDEERLASFANSTYWLNWLLCAGLFGLQCLAAFPIAWVYHDQHLILPICAIALVYLVIPFVYVQNALISRENRLKITAINNTVQISVDNILTAILAFSGWGMWAIVLPKVVVAPLWAWMILRHHDWRPQQFSTRHWREIFGFGRSVLGVELLNTLRNNLDYLIVGALIGVKELGIYYFAFNAGLGISLSFINAMNASLYPYLCQFRANWVELKQRYFESFKTITLIIVPVVLLQSGFAPIYVPLIFGHKWIEAIPVLVLICLSAISRPYADAAAKVLLVLDKPDLNLVVSVLFTGVFVVGLIIGSHWGIIGIAASVLVTHAVFQSLFTVWTARYIHRCQESVELAA